MRGQNLYMLLQSELDILTDNSSKLIFKFSCRLSIMKAFSVGILLGFSAREQRQGKKLLKKVLDTLE